MKFKTEEELGFRPLIESSSKIAPVKQIYLGAEIEKKFILLTIEEDYTKNKNGMTLYDEALKEGVTIWQGYIKDIQEAVVVLQELGINLNEFKPNTIRLREFGPGFKTKGVSKYRYVLTLKDKKPGKTREAEFRLSEEQFNKYWPKTQGARVTKKRMNKVIRKHNFEIDAFIDRFLLIAECEVDEPEQLEKVPVLGNDVSNDKNWSNKALAK